MDTPGGSTPTVLIADDDALVRGVLRMALSRVGFSVIEARDAIEVIDASAEHDPDLIVLDINMPGGTIAETLSALRQQTPRMPVLVLSGQPTPPDNVVGTFTDFARKPINLDDFLARVQRLLDLATSA